MFPRVYIYGVSDFLSRTFFFGFIIFINLERYIDSRRLLSMGDIFCLYVFVSSFFVACVRSSSWFVLLLMIFRFSFVFLHFTLVSL